MFISLFFIDFIDYAFFVVLCFCLRYFVCVLFMLVFVFFFVFELIFIGGGVLMVMVFVVFVGFFISVTSDGIGGIVGVFVVRVMSL